MLHVTIHILNPLLCFFSEQYMLCFCYQKYSSIPKLIKDNTEIIDNCEIANVFNKYFATNIGVELARSLPNDGSFKTYVNDSYLNFFHMLRKKKL